MSKGGVYVLRFSSGHYYGGRTITFVKRFRSHRYGLVPRTHCNHYMQSVFNKYGGFGTEIVWGFDDPIDSDLIALEQVWLDENWGKTGCLNISRFADRDPAKGESYQLLQGRRFPPRIKGRPCL
mgnify:FL=1